jgi:hypothetical protein
MIEPRDFADRQLELNAEFGKFMLEHPEMLDQLPDGAYVFFEVDGETEFNQHSRRMAERKRQEKVSVVRVRVKGVAPPQGSRLIDPVIEPMAGVA